MVLDGEGIPRFDQTIHVSTHNIPGHSQNLSYDRADSDTDSSTSERPFSRTAPEIHSIQVGAFCATDTDVDETLHDLHHRLKHGDRTIQLTIDTYLIACACEDSLPWHTLQKLRPDVTDVLQYTTLPDITRFIQCAFTSTHTPGIIPYYIQLLSPLKRKSRIRRGNPVPPTCNVEASVCLNLIQATLLGLYPRATKQPIWRTRVAIAGCIYQLHTAPFAKQCEFLSSVHDLLRICFTEYIVNVRADFCQIENEFLIRHASFLPIYDTACVTLFDQVRQSCVQCTDWSWENVNTTCLSSLDRVSRMCRTQLIQSHAPTNFAAIKLHDIQSALTKHVLYTDCQTQGYVHTSPTEIIHDTVQVHMLPWNMVLAQAARIVDKFSETLFPILTACEKHICIRCVHGNNSRLLHRVSKLRMDTKTMQISCANCKSDNTVVRVNVFGKLVYIRGVKYFCCQECTSLHIYEPESPLTCTRYNTKIVLEPLDLNTTSNSSLQHPDTANKYTQSQTHAGKALTHRTDKKHRCKWCGRVCSARTLQLLHTSSASVVSVTLCFKHFPAVFMLKMIIDTDAFVRYTIDMANNAHQTGGRRTKPTRVKM
jgi:hypothetical protein